MEKQRGGKLIIHALLLAVLMFGLIRIIGGLGGKALTYELVGFFVLLIFGVLGLIGFVNRWGERLLFVVFLLYLANLVLLWYVFSQLYIVLIILAGAGFLLSFPRRMEFMQDVPYQEPHSQVFDTPQVAHNPGKYVASKRGRYYHEPKSEWAKKISKENRVWFNSKEEAWEQGFKAHADVA
jgi:hypothetical protein